MPDGPGDGLELADVRKRWPGQADDVLAELTFAVRPGEALLIEGRNGVGKTTLLRIITGLLLADGGRVRLGGLDPATDGHRYRRQVGVLSAGSAGLYARLTVRQHLEYWARVAFVPRGERRAAAERVLEEFALAPLADRRVDRMSMGQRQRARLALTFLPRPRLFVLDEPRNSLDDEGLADLAAAVARHRAGGGMALVCVPTGEELHLGEARLAHLDAGRLELR